jgi:aryl-alcohol dehydrogenase-like predicted oxidoreductase
LQNNIDGVLIGVDSLLQLKENIAFLETKISNQYIKEIEKINIQDVNSLNPSLWKSLA